MKTETSTFRVIFMSKIEVQYSTLEDFASVFTTSDDINNCGVFFNYI